MISVDDSDLSDDVFGVFVLGNNPDDVLEVFVFGNILDDGNVVCGFCWMLICDWSMSMCVWLMSVFFGGFGQKRLFSANCSSYHLDNA